MLVLMLLISLLISSGDRTSPRVRSFTWQDKQVGAEDISFSLNFSRPMDHASVESSLKIDPPLPGKFSWSARRMAYTLNAPAPYGSDYSVRLEGARDQSIKKEPGRLIQPFVGQFHSRDRAFVYIGVEGEEKGRLVLYNLTHNQKNILTPKDLVVSDFKPYPEGDRILFSAADWVSQRPGVFDQQIYSVTTGIHPQLPGKEATKPEFAGRMNLVLDSQNYQNMKFDLSADGQVIAVQRVKRNNPGEFGIWILRPNAKPQPLQNQPGGDFVITPDSASLAIAQGEGIAILPLTPAAQPLDFLPKFGKVLSFSDDGQAASMVKFNTDYTRSLFLVTNQGVQKELLKTNGSILNALFDPQKQTLYCLLTKLVDSEQYQEQPYLAAIDLKTSKVGSLWALPNQRDIQMSLSPDGLALLFDQVVTTGSLPTPENLTTSDGQAIATSNLWLLPLTPSPSATSKDNPPPAQQAEQLPLPGFHPYWLP
jgi:hypothetical protein